MSHVLAKSDAIVYAVTGFIPKDRNSFIPYGELDQKRYFEMYVHYANKVGVNWDDLPITWVVVQDIPGIYSELINECELRNPLIEEVRPQHNMIDFRIREKRSTIMLLRSIYNMIKEE